MTIISERLQHLRLTHGYTQTELARTMGVTRRASKVAWDLCPDRVQELAGYPLNGRPSAVTMLELLYNGVARYDDLSILK